VNAATYVNVDVALHPRNGSPMLVIEGMILQRVGASWLVLVVVSMYSNIYMKESIRGFPNLCNYLLDFLYSAFERYCFWNSFFHCLATQEHGKQVVIIHHLYSNF
jgi:hypothetical protein